MQWTYTTTAIALLSTLSVAVGCSSRHRATTEQRGEDLVSQIHSTSIYQDERFYTARHTDSLVEEVTLWEAPSVCIASSSTTAELMPTSRVVRRVLHARHAQQEEQHDGVDSLTDIEQRHRQGYSHSKDRRWSGWGGGIEWYIPMLLGVLGGYGYYNLKRKVR